MGRCMQKVENHCAMTFWLFLLEAKRITIVNAVHFFEETLFSCKFGSKPDSFLLYLAWGLFHVFVSSWAGTSTTAGEKGWIKYHVSASQVLNTPTYQTTLAPKQALPDLNVCSQCEPWKLIA